MRNVRKVAVAASVAVMLSGAGVAALASSGGGAAPNNGASTRAAQIEQARQQLIDARNNIVDLEAKDPNGAENDPAMADLAIQFRTASDNYCKLVPDDHDLC